MAQNRVNRLSLIAVDNFYSLGQSYGAQNNVVRLGDGFGISFKTYDTVKRSGMKYEFLVTNFEAYYSSVSPGGSLKVDDTHTTFNFIFPILIMYQRRIEHWFCIGLGIGTVAGRDYYDGNNNLLAYDSTDLKKIEFGKYWEGALLLDYDLNIQWTKRIATDFGFRYTNPVPFHQNDQVYPINQGIAVGFKLGLSYKF